MTTHDTTAATITNGTGASSTPAAVPGAAGEEPTAVRRTRMRAADRRDQISSAALRAIASHGAARLTAAELAAELGITDAAIFRHFSSMAAIIDAALARFDALLATSLHVGGDTPLARLEAFFRHRLALVRAHPEVLRLAFNGYLADVDARALVRDLGDSSRADNVGGNALRVQGTVAKSQAFIHGCIVDGQAAGVVRRDVDSRALQWTVTGHMRGAALAILSPAGEADDDAVVADLLRLICLPVSASKPGGEIRQRFTPNLGL